MVSGDVRGEAGSLREDLSHQMLHFPQLGLRGGHTACHERECLVHRAIHDVPVPPPSLR